MFSELNRIDFESEARSRRSVITLSILLLIFSNIVLKSDTLSILGLEIFISKHSIVAVLRLLLSISLIAFFFAHVEKAPIRLARYLRKKDEKWWQPIEQDIDDFYAQSHPNYEYEMQQREAHEMSREWDDDARGERYKRKVRRQKIHSYYRPIATFTRTISRLVWPFALSAIALLRPELALVLAE